MLFLYLDKVMRNDLQQSLNRSHIDPGQLSPLQKILLTTDGTVTDILEAYGSELMQVVKLSETKTKIGRDIDEMMLKKGSDVIERKILLRGKISRKNYIYAESILSLDRLEVPFREELLKTKTPIGKIWLEQRVETFKEIVNSGKESAQELANYFDIQPEDYLLFRTYLVFSNRQPTMMITEKFPESYFREKF